MNNGNSGSEFSIDEILAQVRAGRASASAQPEEEQANSRSMAEIDELLRPRKRIEISDILTDELFEAAGEKRDTIVPEVRREEKKRVIPADDKTRIAPAEIRKKNIISAVAEKEEKSPERTAVMETDEVRRRFINRPVQQLEKTAEYEKARAGKAPQPIERPGVVSRRSSLAATADLAPLPTLVPAEDAAQEKSESGFLPKTERENPPEIEGQLRFDAFSMDEDEIDEIDEEAAEEALKKKRQEKVRGFRIFGKNEEERLAEDENEPEEAKIREKRHAEPVRVKEEPRRRAKIEDENDENDESGESGEYTSRSEAPRVLAGIKLRRRKYTLGAAAAFISAAILILCTAAFNMKGVGEFSTLKILNIAAVLISVLAGASAAAAGIKSLFKGAATADTALTAALLAAAVQGAAAFFAEEAAIPLYGGLAAVFTGFTLIGKRMIETRALKNFLFITSKGKKYSVSAIDNKDVAFEVGRGLLMGEPDVRCSVPVEFPSDFMRNTYANDPADSMCKILVPVFALLSAAVGIIYGAVSGGAVGGISAFALCASVSLPVCALIASNLPIGRASAQALKEGAMIAGHGAVEDCGDADGVVFDSSEIFKEGDCTIYGIKTYHNMRIDEAILAAAAVVIQAGGPCGEVFNRVILGKTELLPPVESLAYEDRLGLSAWIHGRRVLVGNRQLLINHNVEAPDEASEQKYRHDDRQIMYLAVAGKISAMFVVGYRANEDIGRVIRAVSDSGVSILIRTSDANITEELVSNFFGLHANAVKILSAVAGEMYQKFRIEKRKNAPAAVLHDGTVKSLLFGVNAAVNMQQSARLPMLIQTAAGALGLALAAILLFLSGFSQLGLLPLVLYQLVSAAVISGVSLVRRKI